MDAVTYYMGNVVLSNDRMPSLVFRNDKDYRRFREAYDLGALIISNSLKIMLGDNEDDLTPVIFRRLSVDFKSNDAKHWQQTATLIVDRCAAEELVEREQRYEQALRAEA